MCQTLIAKYYQGILELQLTKFRAVVVGFIGGNAYGKNNYEGKRVSELWTGNRL